MKKVKIISYKSVIKRVNKKLKNIYGEQLISDVLDATSEVILDNLFQTSDTDLQLFDIFVVKIRYKEDSCNINIQLTNPLKKYLEEQYVERRPAHTPILPSTYLKDDDTQSNLI